MSERLVRPLGRVALAASVMLAIGCKGAASSNGARFDRGAIVVSHVVAAAPIIAGRLEDATMAVYLVIENHGAADTLVAAAAPLARSAMIHEQMDQGNMMPATGVVLPANQTVTLTVGGTHIMLEGLHRALVAGDSVPLDLTFRSAGTLRVVAPVVSYAALDEALGRNAAPVARP
jgi:periplasmic copper chaperone A